MQPQLAESAAQGFPADRARRSAAGSPGGASKLRALMSDLRLRLSLPQTTGVPNKNNRAPRPAMSGIFFSVDCTLAAIRAGGLRVCDRRKIRSSRVTRSRSFVAAYSNLSHVLSGSYAVRFLANSAAFGPRSF